MVLKLSFTDTNQRHYKTYTNSHNFCTSSLHNGGGTSTSSSILSLNHGVCYRFLVQSESSDKRSNSLSTNPSDELISVKMFWAYYGDYTDPNTYCFWWQCNDSLYVQRISVTNLKYHPK